MKLFFPIIFSMVVTTAAFSEVSSTPKAQVVDFTRHGTTIYAAAFENRLMRSTDDGLTWVDVSTPATAGRLAAVVTLPAGTLLAGGVSTLIRSADGGATWADVSVPTMRIVTTLLAIPATGTLLAAGEGVNSGLINISIWRSADGGQSWTQVFHPPDQLGLFSTLAIAGDGDILAGTLYGNTFRSEDDGLTWQPAGKMADSRMVEKIVRADDGHLYATALGKGGEFSGLLFKSTNNGVSWGLRFKTGAYWFNNLTVTATPGEFYALASKRDLSEPGVFLAHSTDYGLTWTFEEVREGLTPGDIRLGLIRLESGIILMGMGTPVQGYIYRFVP